jgi:DNA mismatch repair protein MutS2
MPEPTVPDILHPVPRNRINVEQTKLSIALAFASGVAGGLFSDALDRASIAPTTWQPASFTSDLFVAQFASLCFRGEKDPISLTHVVKLLASPPADRETVDHRRAIVGELAEKGEIRDALEKLDDALRHLRTLLEGALGVGKWDPNRRQLDILSAVKDVIDAMAEGFASSKSGLQALSKWGEALRASEPYTSLADLLRYEERLATLNLKVSVGADGRIRGFQVLSIQEHTENPFVGSPARRWLSKVELFLRGFHFSDGEIIARLIDAVFDGVIDDIVRFVQLAGEVEFYLGALAFRDRAKAAGLAVCLPEIVDAKAPRKVHRLFNPLLLAHAMKPVPCDVDLDEHDAIVLVTGPNSGGKTRLLQSMALAQLLAQCGVFVPAKEATVALVPALVVSLIQETKADQAEGRLGMELVRIRALFEQLPPGAMVVLDELCSGTNPSEGEEIFELVLRMLTRLDPQTFITTHFLAFAQRLEKERKIEDVRFLQVVLGPNHEPTYQFAPGVAATSLAGHAAARLGVTGDQLIALIERNIAASRGSSS